MDLAKIPVYTEDDYYNTPEDVHCELINGQLIYAQATPTRIHQSILSELSLAIGNHIKAKKGSSKVCHVRYA